jgi:hypothetical protein
MEQVRKDHYSAFCKHLPICDPSLGPNFLKEIQVHYHMNSKLKMLTKKFQMFTYSYILAKKMFLWLKMWNGLLFYGRPKNSPCLGFLTPIFVLMLKK